MRETNVTEPLMIDETDAIIVGMDTLEAAKQLLMTTVPVIVLSHLTPVQKRAYAIANHRIPELGEWDREVLGEELRELSVIDPSFSLEITGFETIEIESLTRLKIESDLDEVPTRPTVPTSERDDQRELGDHRAGCGDALNPADLAALIGAGKARAAFLDSPYNVPIVGHVTKNAAHREFQMGVGELDEPGFTDFLATSHRNVADHMLDGGLIYSCMDWRHSDNMADARRASGLSLINICVFAKKNAGQGSFYRSQHELIYVFKKGKAQHLNRIELGRHGRSRSNVFSYQGVSGLVRGSRVDHEAHPTPKPVIMIEDILLDCTEKGDLIIDVFGGGGATLMAAERTGRCARLLEIDPGYVDVIVNRWQNYSGRQATLAGTGLTFAQVRAQRAETRVQQAAAPSQTQLETTTRVRTRTRPVIAKTEGA
jgi:DNA modification methylase